MLHHKSTNCVLSVYSESGGTRMYFVSDGGMEELKIASTALENNYFDRDWNDNGNNRDIDINNANQNYIFEINRVF